MAAVRAGLAAAIGRPIAAVEQRTAASLAYQGLASRLLSPQVAAVLCHGVLAPAAALRWYAADGRLRLALGEGAGAAAAGDRPRAEEAADLVAEHVVGAVLTPLADAVRAHARLAPRLLYGNAASALAGAAATLAEARPEHAADAYALARLLLGRPPLRGLGGFAHAAPGPGAFTRTTCCLYYRAAAGAVCGDCPIAARGARRAAHGVRSRGSRPTPPRWG
ncbi:(2Fe-2S)-binding protein [Streptomonospora wellingtoniae]|uniref:(2Fe-2S)-binding protein n=1 Tax=Streptomonospora wellingtoniae TaxID=3075544 RepID=A0ABU2KWZ0_9ACTN|nr:(2Fe-2S)-binding protein [Streptomonospora sp. DSM 45055]MDT0303768.1 (2Fe-2S)-binding protein [Streptomonospora sp. DSM 45055]